MGACPQRRRSGCWTRSGTAWPTTSTSRHCVPDRGRSGTPTTARQPPVTPGRPSARPGRHFPPRPDRGRPETTARRRAGEGPSRNLNSYPRGHNSASRCWSVREARAGGAVSMMDWYGGGWVVPVGGDVAADDPAVGRIDRSDRGRGDQTAAPVRRESEQPGRTTGASKKRRSPGRSWTRMFMVRGRISKATYPGPRRTALSEMGRPSLTSQHRQAYLDHTGGGGGRTAGVGRLGCRPGSRPAAAPQVRSPPPTTPSGPETNCGAATDTVRATRLGRQRLRRIGAGMMGSALAIP